MEDTIDYLAPYMARIGNPESLTTAQMQMVVTECLNEFKDMMVNRANRIQQQFQEVSISCNLNFILRS